MYYDVRHPEMTMVASRSIIVGYPDPSSPRTMLRYEIASLMHIVRIEPLGSAQTPSQDNGSES